MATDLESRISLMFIAIGLESIDWIQSWDKSLWIEEERRTKVYEEVKRFWTRVVPLLSWAAFNNRAIKDFQIDIKRKNVCLE